MGNSFLRVLDAVKNYGTAGVMSFSVNAVTCHTPLMSDPACLLPTREHAVSTVLLAPDNQLSTNEALAAAESYGWLDA